MDYKSLTEAALLPAEPLVLTQIEDYREQPILSLPPLMNYIAAASIKKAQRKYRRQFDKKSTSVSYKIGDWVLVYFPHEGTGKNCKLSQPWH